MSAPRWPLVRSRGGYNYPDWDPQGHDDHKVKRDADATPVYGDELLISPNGSIGQVNDPESDSIQAQVVCSTSLPLPDAPVASAGDPNDQPASIKHVHPVVIPTVLPKRYYFGNVVSDSTDGSSSQHTLFSLTNL